MIYRGNKLFNYLEKHINDEEVVSSSHWNYYHRDFTYKNNKLSGIKGFGHNSKYFGYISNLVHFTFQTKYRNQSSKSAFFKKINKSAVKIAKSQGRVLGIDILRQILTLDFLNEKKILNHIENILVIGDGFGTMTSLLLQNNIGKRVFLINLRKTLLVDLLYIKKAIGNKRFNNEVELINNSNDLNKINHGTSIVAIEAENYSILNDVNKDLVINIASFQEMDMEVVDNYFSYIYNQTTPFFFYVCNRIRKRLPDGAIISFDNYKFKDEDLILIDEMCPWYQDYYSLKPPFFRSYDGPIKHQLRRVN